MEHWFRNDCGGITVTGRNEPSFEFSWVLAEDLQKLRAGSEGIQADGWGGNHAKQQVCCSLRCQTISFAWLQQTVRQWFHGCSSQQLGQLPALVGPAASATLSGAAWGNRVRVGSVEGLSDFGLLWIEKNGYKSALADSGAANSITDVSFMMWFIMHGLCSGSDVK